MKKSRHQKIKELVEEYEIETQEELAEAVGCTPAFIGHVEAPNITKAISLDTLFAIAEALDIPAYKFLKFED